MGPVQRALAEAVATGAIDVPCATFGAAADGPGVLVLAAPLDGTLELIGRLHEARGGAAPDRRCRLAQGPVAERARGLRGFVPTHPMAGSEGSGPRAARAIFPKRRLVHVPGEDAAANAAARAFIEVMGASALEIDAAPHDAGVSFTSQLPQLLAVALAQSLGARLEDPAMAALCGPGLASMTRLGRSPWGMWHSLLRSPASAAAQEVRTLSEVLAEIAGELEAGSSEALERRFEAALAALDELAARADSHHPLNEAR